MTEKLKEPVINTVTLGSLIIWSDAHLHVNIHASSCMIT